MGPGRGKSHERAVGSSHLKTSRQIAERGKPTFGQHDGRNMFMWIEFFSDDWKLPEIGGLYKKIFCSGRKLQELVS